MATEGNNVNRRTWEDFCQLQGITEPFDLPDLTKLAAYKVVGNAVNLNVSRTIAAAIVATSTNPTYLTCRCSCGSLLKGNQKPPLMPVENA